MFFMLKNQFSSGKQFLFKVLFTVSSKFNFSFQASFFSSWALFKSWIAAGHNQKALGFMKVKWEIFWLENKQDWHLECHRILIWSRGLNECLLNVYSRQVKAFIGKTLLIHGLSFARNKIGPRGMEGSNWAKNTPWMLKRPVKIQWSLALQFVHGSGKYKDAIHAVCFIFTLM